MPPSLVRTHAPTKAATAPAVRPAARHPLSSAVAATPLRSPRRVPPPLVCQHAPTQAAAAPAVSPAARRPPSSAALHSNPSRSCGVPRQVPPSRSHTHAPTQAAAAPAVRPAARRLPSLAAAETHQNSGCRGECLYALVSARRGDRCLKQQPAPALEHTQASAPSVFITAATAATQGHAPCVPAGTDRGDAPPR